jgi:hypothetical protein
VLLRLRRSETGSIRRHVGRNIDQYLEGLWAVGVIARGVRLYFAQGPDNFSLSASSQ